MFSDYSYVFHLLGTSKDGFYNTVMLTFLVGILPMIAGLTLYITGYVKEGKDEPENVQFLAYFIIGAFLTFAGFIISSSAFHSYYDALQALEGHIVDPYLNFDWIRESFMAAYTLFKLLGTLWIGTGLVVAATSAYQFLTSSPSKRAKYTAIN